MRTFTLHFASANEGEAKVMEFRGLDAHEAFQIIRREDDPHPVMIMEGDKLLGVVTRVADDAWHVSGVTPTGDPARARSTAAWARWLRRW